MKQSWVIGLVALLMCAGGFVAVADEHSTPVGAQKPRQPNVVLILADDLGYGDLGCYGQQQILTPHLDRLAAGGLRFTNHYSGSTVCAPSRCCLLTGKHTGHASIRGNKEGALHPGEITVANLLRDAGYATGAVGKWGVGESPQPGDPERYGFASFFGYLDMWHAHNYYPDYLWQDSARVALNGNIVKTVGRGGVAIKRSQYSHDLFREASLKFLEEHQHQPFFLLFASTIPHANNEAGADGMEVPDDTPYQDRDWPQVQKNRAAMISRLDRSVGQLVEKLAELHLENNTLVLFTSDNGPHGEGGGDPYFFHSSGGLRGHKRDLYEGGIRVPLIASWPGTISPGRTTEHLSANWDFLPTFAELACLPTPDGIDGVSFLPTLLDRKEQQRRHLILYWEFGELGMVQAARLGKWKMLRFDNGRVELFDLSSDPGEQSDVAAKNPAVVQSIDFMLQTARQPASNQRVLVPIRRDDDDDDDDDRFDD